MLSIKKVTLAALALLLFGFSLSLLTTRSGYTPEKNGSGQPETKEQSYTINEQGAKMLRLMMIDDAQAWISNRPSAFKYSELITKPEAISANALWRSYNNNEIQADNLYKGKKLLVSGRILSIDKDFANNSILRLSTPQMFMNVMAYLHDDALQEAAEYTPNQNIELICTGDGMIIRSPILRECLSVSMAIDGKVTKTIDDWLAGNDLHGIVPADDVDLEKTKLLLFGMYFVFSKAPKDSACLTDLKSRACEKNFSELKSTIGIDDDQFIAAYTQAKAYLHLPQLPEKPAAATAPNPPENNKQEPLSATKAPATSAPITSAKPPIQNAPPITRITPAPLRNVILDSDWASVKNALAFAYSLGDAKQYIRWENSSNGHQGTVYQSGTGIDPSGCRQFRVSRTTGANTKNANLEVCSNGQYR